MPAANELNHINWLRFLFCFLYISFLHFPFVSLCFSSSILFSGSLLLRCWLTANPIILQHWGLWLAVVLGKPLDITMGLPWRTCNRCFLWLCWLATGAVGSLLPELIRPKTRRIRRKQDFVVPPQTHAHSHLQCEDTEGKGIMRAEWLGCFTVIFPFSAWTFLLRKSYACLVVT